MNKWVIIDNHLALKSENNILHPNANEIYSMLSQNVDSICGIKCNNPSEELPFLRFSTIGSPISATLTSSKEGIIEFEVKTSRKGQDIHVDIIDGIIIDQCVVNNVWFYLSGETVNLQEAITAAGILKNGSITTQQYIKLVQKSFVENSECLHNNVDSQILLQNNVDAVIPADLNAHLFPYQETGYKWINYMLEDSKGCILGDEMGLGKTMQVITELLYLKHCNETPLLVVCPISLLANWQRECLKFAPTLKTLVHYGPDRISNYRDFYQYDVIISSYTTVMSDLHMLNMISWKLVALDEAQNIKNPLSIRTKVCKSLKRERSLAVTGTPFENHISDIWSLIDFICPLLLGTFNEFNKSISDDVDGGKRIEPILSPLMIRRMVSEVAKDLPEKVVIPIPLLFSEFECEQYNTLLQELNTSNSKDNINLGMLQKLRLLCTHPFTMMMDHVNLDPELYSIKYKRTCELIEEIISRGEKVILFTSYKKMFEVFQNDIPKRFGIPIWSINGETPISDRQKIVDIFNSLNESALLVLNPRAAGTGLNITGANHVIHYNLEWNPSLEDQSSARAYRRGQKRTVFIYRLYYIDTVEQVINERIERKRDIASYAIVGNEGKTQDRADILRAISLIPTLKQK